MSVAIPEVENSAYRAMKPNNGRYQDATPSSSKSDAPLDICKPWVGPQ